MIAFALRLTENPEEIRKAEIEKLRAEGLDDAAIVDLTAVAAYFNFINRVALGLGVRLDEALVPGADPEKLKDEMERLDGRA
jgi:alkylhydroperoxidase family enzyme